MKRAKTVIRGTLEQLAAIERGARRGSPLVLANVIIALVSLVSLLLLARMLGPAAYGSYRFFLAVLGTLSITSLTGTANVVLQEAARGHLSAYRRTIARRFRFSLLGVAALVGIAAYFWWRGDPTWYIYLLVAPAFPLLNMFDAAIFYCIGRGEFGRGSAIKAVVNIIPALAILLAAFVSGRVTVVALTYTAALATTWVACFLWLRTQTPADEAEPHDSRYVMHLSAMDAFALLYGQLDKFVVTAVAGFAALGVYAIAVVIPDAIRMQTKVVYALVLPGYSKQPPTHGGQLIRGASVALLISILGAAIVAVLLPWAIPLLLGSAFADAAPYAQVLVFSTIFWIPGLLLSAFLQAHTRVAEQYTHRIVAPIVGTVLYLTLIPLFGIWGAVGAALGAEAVSFVLLASLCARALRQNTYKQGRG